MIAASELAMKLEVPGLTLNFRETVVRLTRPDVHGQSAFWSGRVSLSNKH